MKEGDKVIANHKGCFYPATIRRVDIKPDGTASYLIHYDKWSSKHDEVVEADRLLEKNEENAAYAKQVNEKANAAAQATKTARPGRSRSVRSRSSGERLTGQKRKREDATDALPSSAAKQATTVAGTSFKLTSRLNEVLVQDFDRVVKKQHLVRLKTSSDVSGYTVADACDCFLAFLLHQSREETATVNRASVAAVSGAAASTEPAGPVAAPASAPRGRGRPRKNLPQSNPAVTSAVTAVSSNPYMDPERARSEISASPLPVHVEACRLIFEGLCGVFDRILPTHLLFRFEVQHFADASAPLKQSVAADATPAYSKVYPVICLLRLFVRAPDLIHTASLTPEETLTLSAALHDFVHFLDRHSATLFSQDAYAPAPKDYIATFEHAAKSASGALAGAGAAARKGASSGAAGKSGASALNVHDLYIMQPQPAASAGSAVLPAGDVPRSEAVPAAAPAPSEV